LSGSSQNTDPFIIKKWTELNKKNVSEKMGIQLPGNTFQKIIRVFTFISILAGLFFGLTASGGILIYTGQNPINITFVFITFVVIQMAFMLFPFLSLIFCNKFSGFRNFSFLTRTVRHIFFKVLYKTAGYVDNPDGHDDKTHTYSLLYLLKNRISVYGSVFHWPFFQIIQLFGIFFNIGFIGFTLLKIISSDLAFGWQSTLALSHETVFHMVKNIAYPWSFFISPEYAYPDLAQIEGSRILLKEGIKHLATPDLVAWWPFLCLSIIFYILIPRVLIYAGSVLNQVIALSNIRLKTASARKLLITLKTEYVEIIPESESKLSRVKPEHFTDSNLTGIQDHETQKENTHHFIFLVDNVLYDNYETDHMIHMIHKKCKVKPDKLIPVVFDVDEDKSAFNETEGLLRTDHIFLLMEGWMPPIRETLLYFTDLLNLCSESTC